MMRPSRGRAWLAPWCALLLLGCAAGPPEEEHDLALVEESDLEESLLLARALQRQPAPADQAEQLADDGTAASELARLLHDRLAAADVQSATDGGPPQPVDDEVVSELAATLDRSLELAQQLLAEDASVPHEAHAAPHESAAH